jgi:hypothetical protein
LLLLLLQVLINLLFIGASAFAVFFVSKAYSDSSKSGHWTNSSGLATAQEIAKDDCAFSGARCVLSGVHCKSSNCLLCLACPAGGGHGHLCPLPNL